MLQYPGFLLGHPQANEQQVGCKGVDLRHNLGVVRNISVEQLDLKLWPLPLNPLARALDAGSRAAEIKHSQCRLLGQRQ
tara:strand:+ start:10794 stop:11030 length:237 start_codon:yes stop_codon:yes gene_type:complete